MNAVAEALVAEFEAAASIKAGLGRSAPAANPVMWVPEAAGEVDMAGKALNRDLAKDNPERVFSQPSEIVEEVLMTRGEKLATLTRWRQTILEELSASGEGMRTHGVSAERVRLLEEIQRARAGLSGEREANPE